ADTEGPTGLNDTAIRRALEPKLGAALRSAHAYHCRRCRAPVDRRSRARRPTCPESLLCRRALSPARRPGRPSRGVLSEAAAVTTPAGRGLPVVQALLFRSAARDRTPAQIRSP